MLLATGHIVRVLSVVAVTVALAGCGGSDSSDEQAAVDAAISGQQINQIVDDLNRYWQEADAELGFDYVPIPNDRVSTGDDGVTCDRQEIPREDVEDNAFVDSGCAEGITVAYDPVYVAASLARAEVTMSHEWGHVIQAQATNLDLSLDPDGLPIDAELQADCFAGAWAADRAVADLEDLRIDVAESGDPHGVPLDDPESHGTDQERLDAFNLGHAEGPLACIEALAESLPG